MNTAKRQVEMNTPNILVYIRETHHYFCKILQKMRKYHPVEEISHEPRNYSRGRTGPENERQKGQTTSAGLRQATDLFCADGFQRSSGDRYDYSSCE